MKTIIFKGRAYQQTKSGYYRHCDKNHIETRLHRVIWEDRFGKIPEGFDIHHVDFNKENNDISNLVCLTKHEHQLLHGRTEKRKSLGKRVGQGNKGVPQKRSTKICKSCGEKFDGVPGQTFCSHQCAWDWHNNHRELKYEKICCICGNTFKTYSKKVTTCCNGCTQEKKSRMAKDYARKKGYKVAD